MAENCEQLMYRGNNRALRIVATPGPSLECAWGVTMMRFARRGVFAMGIASLFLGWLSSTRAKSVGFSSTAALRDYVVRILKTKPGVENVSRDPSDPAQ